MFAKWKHLLLSNRGTRQTVIKNIFWLSFSQTTSRFLRAIIIIYAARVLGVAEYGVFSYALGLAGFFTLFADIGISNILTREVAQHKEKSSAYFATSLVIKISLLVITALLIIFAAPFVSKIEKASVLLPFIALLVFFDNMREFCIAFFRAKEKMELEALVNVVTNIAITVFGFIILAYSHTSYAITITYIASAGIGALAGIIILSKEFLNAAINFEARLLKPLISAALPVAFSAILGAFMMNTDTVMLGWWKTEYEVGLYSAGQKIVQVLFTLPAILASSIFPTVSRFIGEKEDEKIKHVIEKTVSAAFLIAIPLSFGGVVVAKELLGFAYGNAYVPGAPAFQILLASMLVAFPGAILGNLMFAFNEQKKLMWYSWIAAAGNIAFNALLIPRFGIVGASIATLFMQTTYNAFVWRATKKLTPFKVLPHVQKIILAGLLMSITALLLGAAHAPVLINVLLSGLSYILFLHLFREPFAEEAKQLLLSLKKRVPQAAD